MDLSWYGKKVLEIKEQKQQIDKSDNNEQSNLSLRKSRRMSLNQTPTFRAYLLDSGTKSKILLEEEIRLPQSARNSLKEQCNSNERHKEQLKDIMRDYPQFNSQIAADYFLNLNKSKLPYHHNKYMRQQQVSTGQNKDNEGQNPIRAKQNVTNVNDSQGIKNNLEREANIQNEIFDIKYKKVNFPNRKNSIQDQDSSLRNLLNNIPKNNPFREQALQSQKQQLDTQNDSTLKMPKLTSELQLNRSNYTQSISQIDSRKQTPKQNDFTLQQKQKNNLINSQQERNSGENSNKTQNFQQMNAKKISLDRLIAPNKKLSNKYHLRCISQSINYDPKIYEQIINQESSKNNLEKKIEQDEQQQDQQNNLNDQIKQILEEQQQYDEENQNSIQNQLKKRQFVSKPSQSQDDIIDQILQDIKFNQSNSIYPRDNADQGKYIKNGQEQVVSDQISKQQKNDLNKFISRVQRQIGNYNYSDAIQKFYDFESKYQIEQQLPQLKQQGSIETSTYQNNMKQSFHSTQQSLPKQVNFSIDSMKIQEISMEANDVPQKIEQKQSRNSSNQLSPEKLQFLSTPRYLSERAGQKNFKYQFCGREKCFSPDKNDKNIYNEYKGLMKTTLEEKQQV